MRPLTIDLDALVSALSTPGSDLRLDLLSGKVLDIPARDENPDIERLLIEEPERLLAVEPLTPGEQLALMEDFLPEVNQPSVYAALVNALQGRKPARTFHNILAGAPPVRAAWQAFERERLRELAQDWLEENELESARPLR